MVLADLPAHDTAAATDVSIQAIGLEAFAQRVGSFRGSPQAERQAHAEQLMNSPVPFCAFELQAAGATVACGQFALKGDLVGPYDAFPVDSIRGQCLAGTQCKHLLTQSPRPDVRRAHLQVEGNNRAARAVHRRLGFSEGYAYYYRTRDLVVA